MAAPATVDLTSASGLALARSIRAGETTSADVLEAHLELLDRVNPRINAVVAQRREEARAEAKAADERIAAARPDEELPPFLGVPCTIKESISLEGMPLSAGLVARKDVRAERSASVVERIVAAGAIPIGVTNTSELTMWVESENRVYGRTSNPYDQTRSAGGSSGGEGSVVGSGASPFGIGSDIGGSIRIPAFFNGVFGHKPTPGLVPTSAQFPPAVGDSPRLLGVGPIARRAEDLEPALRAIAGPDGEDPYVREMPIGDPAEVSLDGLDVIVSGGFAYYPVGRELVEARRKAARALADAGANVREMPLKRLRRAHELYIIALKNVSPASVASMLSDEGVEPPRGRGYLHRRGPHTAATRFLLALERVPTPERTVQRMLAAGRRLGEELIEAIGDGVLLHPPFHQVAPKHGHILRRPRAIAPMVVFNLAGVPVTQVPMGLGSRGLPLGVQVVGSPGNDHLTIAAALELERACGGWVPPRS